MEKRRRPGKNQIISVVVYVFCTHTFFLPYQWACTNLFPNSTKLKSGCIWKSDELSSTPFSETGFVVFPHTTRLDGGASNPNSNGISAIEVDNTCATDHPGYPTPMLKQGINFYRLDTETQELACKNEEDHETLMVFFACCNTTSKQCIDPVATSSSDDDGQSNGIASSGSASAAMGGFSTTDMTIAVVTSAIVAGAGVFAIMRQKTSNCEQEQAAALQMTLMADSLHSL